MERQEYRDMDDEQEEYTIGSLDTSMDRYLERQRLWRKRIPQDGSSLFRALSEALFSTQVHHYDVRLKCIEHMELNANEYSQLITMPLSKYLTHLKDPTTPGGMLEVEALARCYRVCIVVYSGKDHHPVECQYGSNKIMFSLIGYQFDRVITEERRRLLGIVQAYVYKFLYSEVFNQPKVVEQAKAMLRKSDTLYYGVKGASMQKNSIRTEKKSNHELIPVPYRTAKALEPAIFRNVAYDVYMNDHFKKYIDRNMIKSHQHIPFMTHNRLIERFGVKMHLPVSYINPSDCRRVIVRLSNSDELFAYYVGEDSDTNMHNVYLVKFGSMTKTTGEKMLDFPASLGRRPITFAQLKRHTNIYRKLKPCLDASLQFFEERSSRRQRQQVIDYGNNPSIQLLRPYQPLMSPINPTVLYSPPLDNYNQNSNWISPHSSSHQTVPILMPMSNSDQMQLHHRLSVNVTDHYEWSTNPTNYYPGYSTTANSSNIDTMSLNGSLSSNTSTNDSSPYPILAPMPTVFFNQYSQQSSCEQQQQQHHQYVQPTVFVPQHISPRLISEQTEQHIPNEMSSNKFHPNQTPFVVMSPTHPMIGPGMQQPVAGFHPISMVPHIYMDPMNCSPNNANIYPGSPQQQHHQQQSSSPYPLFYSSSPTTPSTPWISTVPLPPHYYVLPNPQQVQHYPFQQLI
ncbi:unnamed protein product [Adineta steineri]|uniref:OTU domain-containing protein n=1 Tax=Adineta steineri TaxID=433720 RepID=A0A819R2Z6_9BILA|nr:unnamed protein product [Adineta steineri]CAF4041188.1 unnamed protein product [Adineta steineri]